MKDKSELEKSNFSKIPEKAYTSKKLEVVKVTALDNEQQKLLLNVISKLTNYNHLPNFEIQAPEANQNGLIVYFRDGCFCFEFDLFENLHKLGMLNYSQKPPPPHETDNFTRFSITTNGEKERAIHIGEALKYKIINEVNYNSLIEFHQNSLKISAQIAEILNKNLSRWCHFKASAFGISNDMDLKSPIYTHFVRPLIEQIRKESNLGLGYNYGTIIFKTSNYKEINWEEFEKMVFQLTQNNVENYKFFEQNHLVKHNFSEQKLAQLLGIPLEAFSTIKVNEDKDIEILFSKSYQYKDFLNSIFSNLKQQNIETKIKDGKILIPFVERDVFEKLLDKSGMLCLLINRDYSFIKEALHIKKEVNLLGDNYLCRLTTIRTAGLN